MNQPRPSNALARAFVALFILALGASLACRSSGGGSSPGSASGDWVARHGLSAAAYQSEFDKWTDKGYRLTHVTGYSEGESDRFAAIWEKKSGPAWEARHGLSGSQLQTEFNTLKGQGYRPVLLSGYASGSSARYVGIWHKTGGPAWEARHGLTHAGFQAEFDSLVHQGYRLTWISGYSSGGADRYTGIWEKTGGPAWQARHGMTSAGYQQEFDQWTGQGYRLARVSGYSVNGQSRYAAIWEKTSGSGWRARHGLTSQNYQSAFDNQYYQGYRLVDVSGFAVNGSPRFAAIWEGDGLSASDAKHVDDTVAGFMDDYNVPGLALAISKDGRLVFAKGYGYSDTGTGWETSPKHLFRVASVSKPITGVAVMKMVEDGDLALSDTVFGSGGHLGTQHGTTPYDTGIEDITVEHLLTHTAGGWPNDSSDPMFKEPSKNHAQLISWVLDNYTLDNTPGMNYAYSNFGFCVVGRVMEEVTGQSYESYVKSNVLAPAGVTNMHIAGDTLADRRPDEVVYYGGNPYGMKVARMDAHGGWIASPIDLVRLAVRVDDFATKPDILQSGTIQTMTTASSANAGYAKGWSVNSSDNWWHMGSLPGTGAVFVRASNGFCWAVLVNQRSGGSFNGDLDGLTWAILGGVSSWPSYDLF